jgi:hypothetical protein
MPTAETRNGGPWIGSWNNFWTERAVDFDGYPDIFEYIGLRYGTVDMARYRPTPEVQNGGHETGRGNTCFEFRIMTDVGPCWQWHLWVGHGRNFSVQNWFPLPVSGRHIDMRQLILETKSVLTKRWQRYPRRFLYCSSMLFSLVRFHMSYLSYLIFVFKTNKMAYHHRRMKRKLAIIRGGAESPPLVRSRD